MYFDRIELNVLSILAKLLSNCNVFTDSSSSAEETSTVEVFYY